MLQEGIDHHHRNYEGTGCSCGQTIGNCFQILSNYEYAGVELVYTCLASLPKVAIGFTCLSAGCEFRQEQKHTGRGGGTGWLLTCKNCRARHG
jgi:hypothetical protein